MNETRDFLAPVGRLLIALLFIAAAIQAIINYDGMSFLMRREGVPFFFLPLAIVLQLVCGVMITLGYRARLAAMLLALFSLSTGLLIHLLPALDSSGAVFHEELTQFWKDLAIAGACLMIVANGAGHFSMDKARREREAEEAEDLA